MRNSKQHIITYKNSTNSCFCHKSGSTIDGASYKSVLMAIMLITVAYSPDREMQMPPETEPKGMETENEFSPGLPPPPTPEATRPVEPIPDRVEERPKQVQNPPGTGTIATKKRRKTRKRQEQRRKIAGETERVSEGVQNMALNEPLETPKTSGAPKRKRALATESTSGSIEQPRKIGYRDAAKCLTVRVTYSGTSGKALSAEDASGLRGALEMRVATQVGVALQFEKTVEANGLLLICCGNEGTKEWTEKTIPSVLEGKFRVAERTEALPAMGGATRANVKLRLWIGGASKPDPIWVFNQLGKQNGLDTSGWRCRATTPAPKGGFNLFFGVGEEALTLLKGRGMSLYFGLSKVTIHKVIRAKRSAPTVGGGAPE